MPATSSPELVWWNCDPCEVEWEGDPVVSRCGWCGAIGRPGHLPDKTGWHAARATRTGD